MINRFKIISISLVLSAFLAACGSTSSASPKSAIDTSVKLASTQPDSFHVRNVLTVSVNSANVVKTTTSGDVYTDPSNLNKDYASLSTSYETSGRSSGSLQALVDNGHVYFNLSGLHLTGAKSLASGWTQSTISAYAHSTPAVAVAVPLNSRVDLLRMLLDDASWHSNGSTSVNGHTATQYVAAIPVSKFEQLVSSKTGQTSSELAHILSIYRLAGNLQFTVDINSNDMPIQIGTSINAYFKSGSTTNHLAIESVSSFSDYGVSFAVHPPTSAKAITNFSSV